MKVRKILFNISMIGFFVLSSPTLAQWSELVPITEINTAYIDRSPFLSYDGLTLYFSTYDTPDWYYARLYQATRTDPYGPFTSVEEINTLNYSYGHILDPWISPDNLRMYYYRTEPPGISRLKFSKRASTEDLWPIGNNITELNSLGSVCTASLTADELTIVFSGKDLAGGKGGYDIWMATRTDRNATFSNIINLTELNSTALDAYLSISPEGLTLYFVSDRNGRKQLFRATRDSVNDAFTSYEHLSFFDSPESNIFCPCLSSDGKALYLAKSISDEPLDIYVSFLSVIPEYETYYVDTANGNDLNDGSSSETAFATIQKGIDSAKDGNTVLVYPGLYTESINFEGKSITVQGVANAAGIPVLTGTEDYGVCFDHNEGLDSILKNFIFENNIVAILLMNGCTPAINNVTIVNNQYGIEANTGAEPYISNSIFWNNINGDLYGCRASYSWIQEEIEPEQPEGLISYWSFNESDGTTIYDSVGANHGIIHGAQWTESQIGSALSFDGMNDYVELPDNNPIWLPQNNFTISIWIYFERESDFPRNELILDLNYANSDDSYNELGYNILIHNQYDLGKLGFQMTTTTNSDEDLHANEIPIRNKWYHIVAVRNNTTQALYLNGRLDESRTCSPDLIDFIGGYDDDKVNIARYTTTLGEPRYHFRGKIDDLRIYDRALSNSEIMQLYQNGISGSALVTNPLFADPNNGDYHLRSKRGRYWPEHDVWVLDDVASPCIDGGDPDDDYSNEPMPNGGRINMGAFGGTPYASMSENEIHWFDPDVNADGITDISDLTELTEQWLRAANWME